MDRLTDEQLVNGSCNNLSSKSVILHEMKMNEHICILEQLVNNINCGLDDNSIKLIENGFVDKSNKYVIVLQEFIINLLDTDGIPRIDIVTYIQQKLGYLFIIDRTRIPNYSYMITSRFKLYLQIK